MLHEPHAPSPAQVAWEGPKGQESFKKLVRESGSDHCIDEQGWNAFTNALTIGAGFRTEADLLEAMKATSEATAQRYIQAAKRNRNYQTVVHGPMLALNPLPTESGRSRDSDSLPLGPETSTSQARYADFRSAQLKHRRR